MYASNNSTAGFQNMQLWLKLIICIWRNKRKNIFPHANHLRYVFPGSEYTKQAKDDNLTFVQNLDFLIKH